MFDSTTFDKCILSKKENSQISSHVILENLQVFTIFLFLCSRLSGNRSIEFGPDGFNPNIMSLIMSYIGSEFILKDEL